jgi:hypothetical protein
MISLVLLPGMDGTGDLFAQFISALGEEYEITVVSYPPDQPLDYSALERIIYSRLPHDRPFIFRENEEKIN